MRKEIGRGSLRDDRELGNGVESWEVAFAWDHCDWEGALARLAFMDCAAWEFRYRCKARVVHESWLEAAGISESTNA